MTGIHHRTRINSSIVNFLEQRHENKKRQKNFMKSVTKEKNQVLFPNINIIYKISQKLGINITAVRKVGHAVQK